LLHNTLKIKGSWKNIFDKFITISSELEDLNRL